MVVIKAGFGNAIRNSNSKLNPTEEKGKCKRNIS